MQQGGGDSKQHSPTTPTWRCQCTCRAPPLEAVRRKGEPPRPPQPMTAVWRPCHAGPPPEYRRGHRRESPMDGGWTPEPKRCPTRCSPMPGPYQPQPLRRRWGTGHVEPPHSPQAPQRMPKPSQARLPVSQVHWMTAWPPSKKKWGPLAATALQPLATPQPK